MVNDMTKKAFDKIAAGLEDAIAIVRSSQPSELQQWATIGAPDIPSMIAAMKVAAQMEQRAITDTQDSSPEPQ